MYYSAR